MALPAGHARAQEWLSVTVVSFKDFDDVELLSDRGRFKAFFVGVKPMHAEKVSAMKREQLAQALAAKLGKSALFARVFVEGQDRKGVILDAFAHHKHDFGHTWDPNKYCYCGMAWGGYNFNLYFVSTGQGRYEENFKVAQHRNLKELFDRAVKEHAAKPAGGDDKEAQAVAALEKRGAKITRASKEAGARVLSVTRPGDESGSLNDEDLKLLQNFHDLEVLDLSDSSGAAGKGITDEGLKNLKGLKKLRELKLSFNFSITDKGLEYLKGLDRLERLELGYTKVTRAGVNKLRESLPQAKISGP
jgi:hypothetical protein